MKTGKFGDQYRGLTCNKAKGNGASQLICTVDKKRCPYQHFCTKKRIFEMVSKFTSCPKQSQK